MTKLPSREQLIRRGVRYYNTSMAIKSIKKMFSGKKNLGKEIWIDAVSGPTRTLWYGWENTEPTPVYFDLHGGGFMLGCADDDEPMNLEIEKQIGCKIVSIDYAKAPRFPFPFAVNQIYAVIDYLYEHSHEYGIDPGKMAIGGHSAGGNLSAVICLKAIEKRKIKFVCQILDYPPLDLATSALNKPQPRGSVPPKLAMMFDACYVDPALAREPYVSPVFTSPERLSGLPPALIILAGKDSLHDEGLKYCGLLGEACVVTECLEYPDSPHGFTYGQSADALDARRKMAAFLKKHLYEKGT